MFRQRNVSAYRETPLATIVRVVADAQRSADEERATCASVNFVSQREDPMPKPRVLATRPLFPAAQQILNASCDVEYWTQPERISQEELLRRVKDKEGLVCLLTEKVNEELLRAAPKLRIAANVAVGFDNIDVPACTKRGVVATNTPGVLDETTADFAWTLLMAVARRLGEGEAVGAVRQLERLGSGSARRHRCLGQDAGNGRIWAHRASRGAARGGFQMKVIYTRCDPRSAGRRKGTEGGVSRFQCRCWRRRILSACTCRCFRKRGDCLTAPKFFRMKPTAFLINTSRGPVVDEVALVHALETREDCRCRVRRVRERAVHSCRV